LTAEANRFAQRLYLPGGVLFNSRFGNTESILDVERGDKNALTRTPRGKSKGKKTSLPPDSSLSKKPIHNNKARPKRPCLFIAVRFVF
jgi:hypothetical protein